MGGQGSKVTLTTYLGERQSQEELVHECGEVGVQPAAQLLNEALQGVEYLGDAGGLLGLLLTGYRLVQELEQHRHQLPTVLADLRL